jgi:hypothetical protein
MIQCGIYGIEHGSDHKAIETTFDIDLLERVVKQRLLFKEAPWKRIRDRIGSSLQRLPLLIPNRVQCQTDQLMTVVLEAIYALTPKAKPSPYAKRWWTKDLTKLRRVYTHFRNRARTLRRAGIESRELEQQAKDAAKEYHDAIRRQKKAHWNEFLEDNANI